MRPKSEKEQAISLRRQGKTYSEIKRALVSTISKGTLSYWFANVQLTPDQRRRIKEQNLRSLERSRLKALAVNKGKRDVYIASIARRVKTFSSVLKNRKIGKVILSILYITEGSRSEKGSITFGNSDPYIISLFLHLLRFCYSIDEQKLRCTVQCRADQSVPKLSSFWAKVTRISKERFCKPQVDTRTVGKPTKKPNYQGVCRINYFSADLSHELRAIARTIYTGPVV